MSLKRPTDSTAAGSTAPKRPKSASDIVWTSTKGRESTLLHGTHLEPAATAKAVLFDLDSTLIKTKSGTTFARDADDWTWWNPAVPIELNRLVQEGLSVVIISNQAGLKSDKQRAIWKRKLKFIAESIPTIPFVVLAATAHDAFRKPLIGMWTYLQTLLAQPLVPADCLFVGDAVGRPRDHSDADRKFALNIGIPCHTPEEYFLKLPAEPFTLSGFAPSAATTISNAAVSWAVPNKSELLLLIGRPKSGKTHYFATHLKPLGYDLVSTPLQIPSIGKMLRDGKSVVLDTNNSSIDQRKKVIAMAKAAGSETRAALFNVSLQLAWHINQYHAFSAPNATWKITAESEFTKYTKGFQLPKLGEGISEIIHVTPNFEPESESELRRWRMWHLPLSGKK